MRTDVREGRPFWSVMIPACGIAPYLAGTLRSVLDERVRSGEMEIVVVDDATDDPSVKKVTRDVGRGRVFYRRNSSRLGLAGNWNECVRRARGRWIHILHQDDEVLSGFYRAYRRVIEDGAALRMVAGPAVVTDDEGTWKDVSRVPYRLVGRTGAVNILEDLVRWNFLLAPSVVVARAAYTDVGLFDVRLGFTLDWDLWLRIAANGPVGWVGRPCALYRRHAASETDRGVATMRNVLEIEHTARRALHRLDAARREGAWEDFVRHLAHLTLEYRCRLHRAGRHGAAWQHALFLFRTRPSVVNGLRMLRSTLRWATAWLRGARAADAKEAEIRATASGHGGAGRS